MKRKRILFVEQNTDGTIGGSHFCLLEVCRALRRDLYLPMVLFYQDNGLVDEFKKASCQVFIFDRTKGFSLEKVWPGLKRASQDHVGSFLAHFFLLSFQRGVNLFAYRLPDFFRFIFLIKRWNISLVHLNNAPSMGIDRLLLSKMMRIKCITHNRGNCDLRPLQKYFVKYYDAIICISRSVLEYIQKQNVSTSNAIIIHDGIDHKKVLSSVKRSSREVREEFGVTGVQPFIGMVGNIKEWKGQEIVVKAAGILKKIYPDIKCLLVGDCSNLKGDLRYMEGLRNRVKKEEVSKNVIFTGYRRDTLDIMSALDIVLHASIEPEPFGRVVLEAMVLGKPVIATNFGGPAEIIQDGDSGLLVPPGNAYILAEATHCLLENPRERARIAKAGKARVAQFHLRHNVQKTEELYQKLLG